jgi:glutaryl-CoA dehydrogenase
MRTVARRDGPGWILNGSKMWITNGSVADVAVVFAKTEEGIQGFLIEAGTAGFRANEIHRKWSLRASVTSELVFEECRIPDANRLPGARGLKTALACLTQARYGIAWGAVGAAMACYATALAYAGSRVQFDLPIAHHQLIQHKLVEMLSGITRGQLLALRLGQMKEAGSARFDHVSLAKRDNVRMALEVARSAREILGASGIVGASITGFEAYR